MHKLCKYSSQLLSQKNCNGEFVTGHFAQSLCYHCETEIVISDLFDSILETDYFCPHSYKNAIREVKKKNNTKHRLYLNNLINMIIKRIKICLHCNFT